MQTRKRAKSITFGRPKKVESNSTESEETKVATSDIAEQEEKVVSPPEEKKTEKPEEPTEAAKKVIEIEEPEAEEKVVEKEEVNEKEEAVVLSDKPEVKDNDTELSTTPDTITPAEDFITDTAPDTEPVEEVKEPEPKADAGLSAVSEPTLSTPILESEAKPETPADETTSEELSATPPASAFSLQEGGDGGGDSGGKKKNFIVYFLVIALFSFILGIGAMAILASGFLPVTLPKEFPLVSQMQTVMKTTPTVAPTQKPAPTTAPTAKPVDLTAYTVSVLNGSGIKGKAAEVKTSLTTAGFTIGTTGNAATSNFDTTQISAKKDVDEAFITALKTELEKDFKVEVTAAPTAASQANDVVVTLGSETAN